MTRGDTDRSAESGARVRNVWRRLWSHPYVLIIGTMMLWGGNGAAARLAVDGISPMLLVLLRWLTVCLILVCFRRRELVEHLHVLRAHWLRLAILAFLGLSGFNAVYYLAAFSTSAINLTLLQSTTPIFVLVGAALVLRLPVKPPQIVGIGISFVAIGLIAAHGDLRRLSDMAFGRGDLLAVLASAMNAAFMLGLRNRPPVPALVYFAGLAFAALVEAIPMAIGELATGHTFLPTPTGWLVALYSALGSSFVGQLAFVRAVELIGPARVSLFNNLLPIFGAIFAVLLVGEHIAPYHGLALALALGGIYLAERRAI